MMTQSVGRCGDKKIRVFNPVTSVTLGSAKMGTTSEEILKPRSLHLVWTGHNNLSSARITIPLSLAKYPVWVFELHQGHLLWKNPGEQQHQKWEL